MALSLYAEAATPWRDTAGRLHAGDAANWRDLLAPAPGAETGSSASVIRDRYAARTCA